MNENDNSKEKEKTSPLSPLSLSEDLCYLLAFNNTMLNLIPDGVAVVDEALKVRSANARFGELLGRGGTGNLESLDLSSHPVFRSVIQHGGREKPLWEWLRDLPVNDDQIDFCRMEVQGDGEYAGTYAIRARTWDEDDDQSSRILIWIHKEGAGERNAPGREAPEMGIASHLAEFSKGLLDNIPVGVCELAPGLFLRRANESTEKIVGRYFDVKADGTDHLFTVLPELCCDELLGLLEKSVETERPVRGETSLTRNNGDILRLSVEICPPIPGGEMESTLLLLQPDSAEFLLNDRAEERNGTAEPLSSVQNLISRDFPGIHADMAAPVNAEVQSLLTALDLLLDFDRLCARVLEMGLEMTGGVSGSLMLLTEGGCELTIVSARGLADPIIQTVRQRLGEGIAGSVAEKGEPLLLQGRIGDTRFRGVGGRPEVHSSVCVPVTSNLKVLGVLNINSHPGNPPFTDEQLGQVITLGRQIGGALDKSRQLQKAQRRSLELAVRAEIEAAKFSAGTLGSKLEMIAGKIKNLLGFDICAIYIKDGSRNSVTLRAISGLEGGGLNGIIVPLGTGHVGWVASRRKPLVLRSVAHPSFGDDGGPKMTIALPICYEDDLLGVLSVESTSRLDLDNSDMELTTAIAAAIGLMIGDVRSQEYSSRKLTMLSALGEMGVAFTAAREREGLARLVAFCSGTVLESDIATVRILSEQGDQHRCNLESLDLLATHGTAPPATGDPLARLDALMVELLIARKEPCGQDVIEHPNLKQLMAQANVADLLGVPLMTGEEIFGSVVVYRAAQGPAGNTRYGKQEHEIARRLGDYAGAAASQFTYWSRSGASLTKEPEPAGV